ncbi:MAG: histidine phosphatase family protein, partial [Campylobacterales bacterium]
RMSMVLYLIRHSLAMDRSDYDGADDLDRPLVAKGIKRAKKLFKVIRSWEDPIELIIYSEAARSSQTAEILADHFPDAQRRCEAWLNPGARPSELAVKLEEVAKEGYQSIALVGHEPELSKLCAHVIGDSRARLNFTKPSVAVIEYHEGTGNLVALVGYQHVKEIV